jgi:hypothetical protein
MQKPFPGRAVSTAFIDGAVTDMSEGLGNHSGEDPRATLFRFLLGFRLFCTLLQINKKPMVKGGPTMNVPLGTSSNDCTRQSEGKRCQREGCQRPSEGRAVEKCRRWNSAKALWHRHSSALCATTSAFLQIHRDPHSQLGPLISKKSRYAISHSTSTILHKHAFKDIYSKIVCCHT